MESEESENKANLRNESFPLRQATIAKKCRCWLPRAAQFFFLGWFAVAVLFGRGVVVVAAKYFVVARLPAFWRRRVCPRHRRQARANVEKKERFFGRSSERLLKNRCRRVVDCFVSAHNQGVRLPKRSHALRAVGELRDGDSRHGGRRWRVEAKTDAMLSRSRRLQQSIGKQATRILLTSSASVKFACQTTIRMSSPKCARAQPPQSCRVAAARRSRAA